MKKYKTSGDDWIAPVFIVAAILAIWLSLSYLPADVFGPQWSTFKDNIWTYTPWLIAFGIGLFTLKQLLWRRRR